MGWPLVFEAMLVCTVVSRLAAGSWLSPAPLFCAYWLAATFVPIAFVARFPVSVTAGSYILAATAAVTAGGVIGCVGRRPELGRNRIADPGQFVPSLLMINLAIYAGTLAGLLAALLVMLQNGISPLSLTSFSRLISSGNLIDTSAQNQGESIAISMLLAFGYLGAFVSPFRLYHSKRVLSVLAPTLGVLAYSIISTRREPFLLCAGLSVAVAIQVSALRHKHLYRFRVRQFGIGLATVVLLAAAFVGISFVRVGSTGGAYQTAVYSKTEIYAFGYLPAFDSWVQTRGSPSNPDPLTLGSETFGGITSLPSGHFGSSKAFSQRAVIDQAGDSTNVFSSLRGVLDDFGIVGYVVFFLLFGLLSEIAQSRVLRRNSILAACVTAGFIAWILTSATESPFLFTNVTLGVVAGSLLLRIWSQPGHATAGVKPLGALRAARSQAKRPRPRALVHPI